MAAAETNLSMSATEISPISGSGGTSKSGGTGPNSSGSTATGSNLAPTYAAFAPPPTSLPQHASPLLQSTPPTVVKALSQAYPLILFLDYILGLLTWTGDEVWTSFLLVISWVTVVLYFNLIIQYFGHLLVVASVAAYVYISKYVQAHQLAEPTLDAIVHSLNNVVTRMNLFLQPVTSLQLGYTEVWRLLCTSLFLTPLYIILAFLVLKPKMIVLLFGSYVLTYHSTWARVTREILWRSRLVRLLVFYLTSLDFSRIRKTSGLRSETQIATANAASADKGKPIKFTYVLYENQRRWLGIGWSHNLLMYERSAWTDEFLNESVPPTSFQLPDAEGTDMQWRWVDPTWRLDLTNDGALIIKGKKTWTPDPSPNDGFIYYDNLWRKPSSEDSYSKYTRRRRWIRSAELISDQVQSFSEDSESAASSPSDDKPASGPQKRKSLRFKDEEE